MLDCITVLNHSTLIVGGHLELAAQFPVTEWYITPICQTHNAPSGTYDRGGAGGVMVTDPTAFAVRIPIHPNY